MSDFQRRKHFHSWNFGLHILIVCAFSSSSVTWECTVVINKNWSAIGWPQTDPFQSKVTEDGFTAKPAMGVFVVSHSTNKKLLEKDQTLSPIYKTSNVPPIFEWQAAINQSAHADKTHHTFDVRQLRILCFPSSKNKLHGLILRWAKCVTLLRRIGSHSYTLVYSKRFPVNYKMYPAFQG